MLKLLLLTITLLTAEVVAVTRAPQSCPALRKSASASTERKSVTAYCSSYLSLSGRGTVTSTSTSTVISTSTSTADTSSTTTTSTESDTATITSGISTVTSTSACPNGGNAKRAIQTNAKRNLPKQYDAYHREQKRDVPKPSVLAPYSGTQLSSACSCFATRQPRTRSTVVTSTTTTVTVTTTTPGTTFITTTTITSSEVTTTTAQTTTVPSATTTVTVLPPTCNLVTDPSFEDVPNSSLHQYGANAGDWALGYKSWFASNNDRASPYKTSYGTIFAILFGDTGNPDTATQNVNLPLDGVYTLGYSFAIDTYNPDGSTCTFTASFGGQLLDSFVASDYGNTGNTYTTRTATFTTTAGSGNLVFMYTCRTQETHIQLDNISINMTA